MKSSSCCKWRYEPLERERAAVVEQPLCQPGPDPRRCRYRQSR